MPTKRTALNRPRTPRIDGETLALFMELNAVPKLQRRRKTRASRTATARWPDGSASAASGCAMFAR